MNKIMKHIIFLGLALLFFLFYGCSENTIDNTPSEKGTLLNLYVQAGANTRLAELGNVDNINTPTDGKQHIGLYIYYQDDYDNNDLTRPYIRNLECKVESGKLVPVNNNKIYVYDRMTIVAFYPYNANASKFNVKTDETEYPITESDYEQQTYIPYRAQTNVNPTNAYMANLDLIPQQTFKIELVLVAGNPADFPRSQDKQNGDIKLLPSIDAHTDVYSNGIDRREFWVDRIDNFTPSTGGQYVRRYNAYIWKSGIDDKHHDGYKHNDNKIEKGDLLFQSNELTLLVPEAIDFGQRIVYRYGYNMNTGEIFVPTSENLVYDAETLQNAGSAYQVCDINLTGFNWTPKKYYNGTYDGGGHAIKGLKINASPSGNVNDGTGKQGFGLFGSIIGNSTLKNINIDSPEITIDFTNPALTDTCYIGALCGIVNPTLPADQIRSIVAGGVPSELSDIVKEALIEDLMKDFTNTTSAIRGCKIEDPQITANGENIIAGGLCGSAGNQKQKASIKDSYVSQTSPSAGIAINAGSEEMKQRYENVHVGGFCGLVSAGSVTSSYGTLTTIHGYVKEEDTSTTPPTIISKDVSNGFCNVATGLPSGVTVSISGCYTEKEDVTTGVTKFSNGWPSSWPLFNGGVLKTPDGWPTWPTQESLGDYDSWKDMGTQPSIYPTLIWESPFYVENN